jgi:phage terminase Nu1 subunit (DNA packaging protein)
VDRWQLAALFDVHPDRIPAWLHEGLDVARVRRGGPGRPALYDVRRAERWLAERTAAALSISNSRARRSTSWRVTKSLGPTLPRHPAAEPLVTWT